MIYHIQNISKSIDKLENFVDKLEKGDPFIEELQKELKEIEVKLLKGLEEDERIKAQKKAS